MELTEIYQKGEAFFREKEFGRLLGYVETGYIQHHDREVLDRFAFRQKCIDSQEASTVCSVLGLTFSSPVVMSSMTMPIPAIADDALMQLARGLKSARSLMRTGTPIPQNLRELAATGVSLAANVKPFKDRDKLFALLDDILAQGVTWVGIEIDAAQGTKIGDKEMGFECSPKGVSDLITGITRELSRLMTMVGAKDPTKVKKGILIER